MLSKIKVNRKGVDVKNSLFQDKTETFSNFGRLSLYNHKNSFINQNQSIMKKVFFSAAVLCLSLSNVSMAMANEIPNPATTSINVKNLDVSSFCKAIMQGDIETVQKLIDLGEDVNQKSLGMTPAILLLAITRLKFYSFL